MFGLGLNIVTRTAGALAAGRFRLHCGHALEIVVMLISAIGSQLSTGYWAESRGADA
jgi:hypothetical protein